MTEDKLTGGGGGDEKENNDWDCYPLARNYFREQQQQQIRTFISCNSLEHPLSRMHDESISAIHKINRSSIISNNTNNTNNTNNANTTTTTTTTITITKGNNKISNTVIANPLSNDEDGDDMDLLFNPNSNNGSGSSGSGSNNNNNGMMDVVNKEKEILDPLTAASMGLDGDNNDPLFQNNMNSSYMDSGSGSSGGSGGDGKTSVKEQETMHKEFEGWKAKRDDILRKYTSNKQVKVTAKFLDERSGDGDDGDGKQQTEEDHLKQRVGQLGPFDGEDPNAALMLSQAEYIKRMENNVQRLRKAWKEGKRVLALKIAIQCSKMLGDNAVTTCPQFYPSMYVLIADVLDSFGDLVFERLVKKANEDPDAMQDGDGTFSTRNLTDRGSQETGDDDWSDTSKKSDKNKKSKKEDVTKSTLRENFTYMDVNLYAKDTCLNWFYKIACIRELLPRLFIELSLFKCWRFVRPTSDYPKILKRLARIIRGIGDPLVAAYARAYWVHRGFEICGDSMRQSLLETFDDFLFVFNEIEKHKFQNIPVVVKNKINESDYIDLYSPALDWIIQCIGYKAREEEFFALLQRYKDGWNNSIILLHILSQFESSYISKHCKMISTLIKESVVTTIPRSKLYQELGKSIVKCAPPPNIRLEILNEIWKVVSKITVAQEYVQVASVYIEYILQHFTKSEIDILLNDVIKHLKKDLAFRELQDDIYRIVCHILRYSKDFKVLFEINNFLPLIDMLENTNKMNACKMVLEAFMRGNHSGSNEEGKEGFKSTSGPSGMSDPVMIHSLLEVSRMLHDSIDYLTLPDERRQISDMIAYVVDCIDYGVDLERQLNEYVECRAMFSNLDAVIYNLVTKVGDMAMKACRFMQGKHDKKTSAFVKACLAYCHITIPSLEDLWPRMYLFSSLGTIALNNQMTIQAEGFLRAAISLIPQLPTTFTSASIQYSNAIQSTSSLLCEYIEHMCSVLLLLPGHPENGPFYVLLELLEALNKYPPWVTINPEKIRTWQAIFKIFCTYSQAQFPYRIVGVTSNDQLFGQNPKYIKLVRKQLNKLAKDITNGLELLSKSEKKLDQQECGNVCLEWMNVLIDFVEMNEITMQKMQQVHTLALKAPNLNATFLENTLSHIRSKNEALYLNLAA